VPCHGLQHYNIDVKNGEMSFVHFQRSGDVPIGVPFNMVHYALLLIMVAQVTGLQAAQTRSYYLECAHVRPTQRLWSLSYLTGQHYPFPMLKVDPTVKRLEDFRIRAFFYRRVHGAHPPIRMGGTAV
jgi:thymidylate synthase